MNTAVLEAIANRRSVRHFTDQTVTREQLEILIKAGMAAPSAMNLQPWSFLVIQDRSRLDALASVCPYAKMLSQANAAIVVCGIVDPDTPFPRNKFWIQDCAAATQNILLAAEAVDLGAVWTAVSPIDELVAAVSSIIQPPQNIVPFCIIPIGYPARDTKPKDKYDATRCFWDTFS